MSLRPTLALAALLALVPLADGFADDKAPEKIVEEIVENEGGAPDGEAEGADLGEASYNTRDCEDESELENVAENVEADDLDAECEPMVK